MHNACTCNDNFLVILIIQIEEETPHIMEEFVLWKNLYNPNIGERQCKCKEKWKSWSIKLQMGDMLIISRQAIYWQSGDFLYETKTKQIYRAILSSIGGQKGTHVVKSGLCKDILKCGEDENGSSATFSCCKQKSVSLMLPIDSCMLSYRRRAHGYTNRSFK